MRLCCSAEVRGRENLKYVDHNAIVATNHITEIDPLLIIASLPFRSRLLPLIFVAREKRYYKTRWKGIRKLLYGGTIFRFIGGYEAYSGKKNYEKSLSNHLRELKRGGSVCIFPVGKLHDNNAASEAKGGAAFLAAHTNLPIIPINMQGLSRRTTLLDCLLGKPKLIVSIGTPLYAKDIFAVPTNTITASSNIECNKAAAVLMERILSL